MKHPTETFSLKIFKFYKRAFNRVTLKVKLILDSPPTHQSSHRTLHSLNWKGKFILPRISIWIEFIKELILIQIGRHIKIGSREECLSQFRRCLCVIYVSACFMAFYLKREEKWSQRLFLQFFFPHFFGSFMFFFRFGNEKSTRCK